MKKYTIQYAAVSIISLFAIIFSSCSNDFLHVEQKIGSPVADTIFMTDFDQQMPVNFNLPKAGNAHWRVFQLPAWMKVVPQEGQFEDGKSSFQLTIPEKTAIPQWGMFNLPLIFEVEGIGLVQYPLQFINFGRPRSGLSTYDLQLEYQSMGVFTLHNLDGGILIWEITDKPSWISVSKQKGFMNPNSAEIITLLISRDNLVKGNYSGEINIAVNSIEPNLKLKVSMKVSDPSMSGQVESIEGEVVDADFCKATGLMVVAAKNPNRMYFYQPDQPVKSLDLNKIPISVTISETGDQIAATFTNTDLSLISPESFTITKNIQTGMIASDIALGGNGWAYLAPKPYDTSFLQSIDLNSGQIVKNTVDMNGLTILKKVPGKNLLYGSKVGWSPDFLEVFDISKGAVNSVVDQYWVTLSRFWLSEDGQHVFSGMRKIYQSPEFVQKGNMMDPPLLAGEIENIAGTINAIDHSSILKEMFVVYKAYSYEVGTRVLRIDDSGFFTKSAFRVGDCVVTENGFTQSIDPEVPYMFVSKSGKELGLIKKGMSNSGKVYWFYEKITLK